MGVERKSSTKDQASTELLERRKRLKQVGAIAVAGGGALVLSNSVVGGLSRVAGLFKDPSTTKSGGVVIPTMSEDPRGAAPGTVYYRSDLGDLRVIDGVERKPQSMAKRRPFLIVGGEDPGVADFGSFTRSTNTGGFWEAFQALPTGKSGRKSGRIFLMDGTYDLSSLPASVFPIDIGDALIEGSGYNTVIVGATRRITFSRPSGHGRIVDVLYQGL